MKRSDRQGFTLIELSLVLVIIALLVGGVLVGKTLIKTAQARQAISAIDRIGAAVNTFKSKYNCLPGDCASARKFFPTCTADDVYSTCNGDGNGKISNGNNTMSAVTEGFVRMWEHLNLSGLFPSNIQNGTFWPTLLLPGVNTPSFSWLDGNFGLHDAQADAPVAGIMYQDTCSFPGVSCDDHDPGLNVGKGHRLFFTGRYTNNHGFTEVSDGINGDFAQSIDMKMDDGRPLSGRMRAYLFSSGGYARCTNGTQSITQPYRVTQNCTVMIDMSF
jgi:prepilin-type N-terminal cleavage/methylation domain-containing protein